MSSIGFYTIVKNEQRRIGTLLNTLKHIASELIVVDTGSSDDTCRIAKSTGAKIIYYPDSEDFSFSRARNMALDNVSAEWILTLDADEEIDPEDLREIERLTSLEDYRYYIFGRFSDITLYTQRTIYKL